MNVACPIKGFGPFYEFRPAAWCACREAMQALLAIEDPGAPGRPAFDRLRFRRKLFS